MVSSSSSQAMVSSSSSSDAGKRSILALPRLRQGSDQPDLEEATWDGNSLPFKAEPQVPGSRTHRDGISTSRFQTTDGAILSRPAEATEPVMPHQDADTDQQLPKKRRRRETASAAALAWAAEEAKYLAERNVKPGYILPAEGKKQPLYDIPEGLPHALVQAMVDIIPALPDMRLQFYREHIAGGEAPQTTHDDKAEFRDPSRFPCGTAFRGHTTGKYRSFLGLAR